MPDFINPDLSYQILIKLPPKSLLRFRTVSKSWKSVVDSKAFILDHLSHQNPQIIAQNDDQFLVIDPRTLPNLKTLNSPQFHYDQVKSNMCSVHGVICFNIGCKLHLWNPSIHRRCIIKPPYYLVANSVLCGFWINPSTSECKIAVHVSGFNTIWVYSSTTRAWREVDKDIKLGWRFSDYRQVLINDVAYCLASLGSFKAKGVICSFDFAQEKFTILEMPSELAHERMKTNVWKWRDSSLSLLHWKMNECNLWAMESGSWCKMYSISVPSKVKDVLFVEETSERVLAHLGNGNLMMYDPKMSLKRKRLAPDGQGSGRFFVAYDFVESFISPPSY